MLEAQQAYWHQVEQLFHRSLELPADRRRDFLEEATGGDSHLVNEVLGLLTAHEGSHFLLDAPQANTLSAGTHLGRYELERILGAGGMGTVYLAHRADKQFHKLVAIKLINQGFATAVNRSRFDRERQILANLEHPNIARLLDAGLSEYGQPYLVMERVDGVPLDQWMEQRKPSLHQRIELWLQIAEAVSYAHRNLIVHRDLKPSNILVTAEGIPKLVDFGIAKLLSDSQAADLTRTQHFTPLYASPEQIRGEPVTTGTDVYGLGLILYELAAGEHPYRNKVHDIVDAVLNQPIRVPTTVLRDLAAIIEMALRKEAERRYATMDQFAEDVRRYRRGLPVIAQPETVSYRVRKFVGRNKLEVSMAAIVIISLISLSVSVVSQARRAERELARAEKVTEFLSAMMGITPEGTHPLLRSKGASLRVVELVDAVTQRTDNELSKLPEAEAALRYVAGSVYNQLGWWERANTNAQRAMELNRKLYPPSDARRINAEILQATTLHYLGETAEAEQLALAVQRDWVNPTPAMRMANCTVLGVSQFRLGKLDAAEGTLQSCVSVVQSAAGANNEFLTFVMSDLALVYFERGQLELAKQHWETAIANSPARSSGSSEGVGWALGDLANVYRFMGQRQLARRNAEDAYGQLSRSLGESNPGLIHSMSILAWAKALDGDTDAEPLIYKAMALQENLPADHIDRAVTSMFHGLVLMQENRLSEARPHLEHALAIRRLRFTAPNWRIAEAAGYLGEALARSGDNKAARPLLQESLTMFTQAWGPSSPGTRVAQDRLDRWK